MMEWIQVTRFLPSFLPSFFTYLLTYLLLGDVYDEYDDAETLGKSALQTLEAHSKGKELRPVDHSKTSLLALTSAHPFLLTHSLKVKLNIQNLEKICTLKRRPCMSCRRRQFKKSVTTWR